MASALSTTALALPASPATVWVTGTTSRGIYATNAASATNLTINTATVTGAKDGIRAINNGTGTTTIASTAQVTGTGHGISAKNTGTTLLASPPQQLPATKMVFVLETLAVAPPPSPAAAQ